MAHAVSARVILGPIGLTGIDSTGTDDVSAPLQTLINTTVDGSSINFGGGTYRVEAGLTLVNRTGITFRNATFIADYLDPAGTVDPWELVFAGQTVNLTTGSTVDGSGNPLTPGAPGTITYPAWPYGDAFLDRVLLGLTNDATCSLVNVTVRGPMAKVSRLHPGVVVTDLWQNWDRAPHVAGQHGFAVNGCSGLAVMDCTAHYVAGDSIVLRGNGATATTGTTMANFSGDWAGAAGLGLTHAADTIFGGHLGSVRGSVFDCSPANGQVVQRLAVDTVTVGYYQDYLVHIAGAGDTYDAAFGNLSALFPADNDGLTSFNSSSANRQGPFTFNDWTGFHGPGVASRSSWGGPPASITGRHASSVTIDNVQTGSAPGSDLVAANLNDVSTVTVPNPATVANGFGQVLEMDDPASAVPVSAGSITAGVATVTVPAGHGLTVGLPVSTAVVESTVASWSPSTAYTTGQTVNYGGTIFTATTAIPTGIPPHPIGDGSAADRAILLAGRCGYAEGVTGGDAFATISVTTAALTGAGSITAARDAAKAAGGGYIVYAPGTYVTNFKVPSANASFFFPSNTTINAWAANVTWQGFGVEDASTGTISGAYIGGRQGSDFTGFYGSVPVHDVIITGVKFNCNEGTADSHGDVLAVRFWARNIWVDHCFLTNPQVLTDGLCDTTSGSFSVTYSWCDYYRHHKAVLAHSKDIVSSPTGNQLPPGVTAANPGPYRVENDGTSDRIPVQVSWVNCLFDNLSQRSPLLDHVTTYGDISGCWDRDFGAYNDGTNAAVNGLYNWPYTTGARFAETVLPGPSTGPGPPNATVPGAFAATSGAGTKLQLGAKGRVQNSVYSNFTTTTTPAINRVDASVSLLTSNVTLENCVKDSDINTGTAPAPTYSLAGVTIPNASLKAALQAGVARNGDGYWSVGGGGGGGGGTGRFNPTNGAVLTAVSATTVSYAVDAGTPNVGSAALSGTVNPGTVTGYNDGWTQPGTATVWDGFNAGGPTSKLYATDSGQWWDSSLVAGSGGGLDGTGRVTAKVAGVVYLPFVPTTRSDGTVRVTTALLDATAETGPAFRVTDASNYWFFGNKNGRLVKRVAGVNTVVTSTTPGSDGDQITVTFAGSSISVARNGTTVVTATDAFNSTATSHGLYFASAATGALLEDFSVGPVVAALSATAARPVTAAITVTAGVQTAGTFAVTRPVTATVHATATKTSPVTAGTLFGISPGSAGKSGPTGNAVSDAISQTSAALIRTYSITNIPTLPQEVSIAPAVPMTAAAMTSLENSLVSGLADLPGQLLMAYHEIDRPKITAAEAHTLYPQLRTVVDRVNNNHGRTNQLLLEITMNGYRLSQGGSGPPLYNQAALNPYLDNTMLDLVDFVGMDCYGYNGTSVAISYAQNQFVRAHDYAVSRASALGRPKPIPWSVPEFGFTIGGNIDPPASAGGSTTAGVFLTDALAVDFIQTALLDNINSWPADEQPRHVIWFYNAGQPFNGWQIKEATAITISAGYDHPPGTTVNGIAGHRPVLTQALAKWKAISLASRP